MLVLKLIYIAGNDTVCSSSPSQPNYGFSDIIYSNAVSCNADNLKKRCDFSQNVH